MKHPILSLLVGGCLGGAAWFLVRPRASAGGRQLQLQPQGRTKAMTNQAEIQKLAAQIAEETKKQKAVEAELANLTASAAAATDAEKKKQLEDAKAKLVAAAAGAAEKTKALKAQAMAKVQAAKAAEASGPLYPEGARARFGEYEALVERAWQANGTWNYSIMINPDALLFKKHIPVAAEQQVKEILAEKMNQPKGPAYPRGLQVFRNGQGGAIDDVKAEGGTFTYQVQGWPNRVTERQLAAILANA